VTVRFGNNTLTPAATVSVTSFSAPATACMGVRFGGCSGPCDLPIEVGDIDGDGKADIYVVYSNTLLVSTGRKLAPPVTFQALLNGDQPAGYWVGLQDLNGDARADLIMPEENIAAGSSAPAGLVVTLFNPPNYHGW